MNKETHIQKAKEWQLDHLPYEIMWIDEKGSIIYLNHLLKKRLQYASEDLQTLHIYDINPTSSAQKWAQHWQEVKNSGTVNFKTIHRRKDGFLYDAEVHAQFFSNNGTDLIFAIVNEITHSSFYRNVLNKAEELVCVGGWKLNLQDNSFIATDQLFEIFGVSEPEAIRPVNLKKFFKAPDQFEQLISSSLATGESYDSILQIEDARGITKWLRCAGEPVCLEDKVIKIIGVYQDVTEAQLNIHSLELYREIINQSNDIVFIWNEAGRLVEFSRSATQQLGFSVADLEEATIYQLDSSIDHKWWSEHFSDLKRRKNFRMEWSAARKDGSILPVDISVNLLKYREEYLNCAILRDISERIQQEENIRVAYKEIELLKNQLEKENEYLQEEVRKHSLFENIIYNSPAYEQVLKQVEKVAPTDTTVLITGESGTGKELLANALHQLSKHAEHIMVKVNCATIPKELFESELFGHRKGAFTGAIANKDGKFTIADGGTIFLDEIGEVPVDLQAKLLRVLQEGEFDVLGGETRKVKVRIIAATNRNLEKMVEAGLFREDLYYRLNVFPIDNIPLRERREDIPLLAQHFLEKYALKAGKKFRRISAKVLDTFINYSFPGNIRELENLIERAVIIEEGPTLFPGSWMPQPGRRNTVKTTFQSFEEMQRKYIIEVLTNTNGKVSGPGGAAEILKMKDKTLFAKIKRLGIQKEVLHKKSK